MEWSLECTYEQVVRSTSTCWDWRELLKTSHSSRQISWITILSSPQLLDALEFSMLQALCPQPLFPTLRLYYVIIFFFNIQWFWYSMWLAFCFRLPTHQLVQDLVYACEILDRIRDQRIGITSIIVFPKKKKLDFSASKSNFFFLKKVVFSWV